MTIRTILRHVFQSNARVGDVSDRINNFWSVHLLLLLSLLAFYESFEKKPISCWCPAEFKSSMIEYVHKTCWESDSYYKAEDVWGPPTGSGQQKLIWKPVYKWLPLILAIQALLFKLPDIFLSVGQGMFGFGFQKILGLSEGYSNLSYNDRILVGNQVGRYIKNWLNASTIKGVPWGPLTFMYLCTKICYFVNSLAQLVLLETFLRSENETSYAHQLAQDITNNETSTWRMNSPVFPRIFMCDFFVRRVTRVHHFTVQCFLNVATFYEGLYGFLWVWLALTTVATSFSLGLFGLKILIPWFRRRFIRQYLKYSEDVGTAPTDRLVADFAGSYITEDGIYIFKAIGEISSDHLVRDAMTYIWNSKFHHGNNQNTTTSVQRQSSGAAPSPVPSAPYQPSSQYSCHNTVIAPPPAYAENPPSSISQSGGRGQTITSECIPLMENRGSGNLYPQML